MRARGEEFSYFIQLFVKKVSRVNYNSPSPCLMKHFILEKWVINYYYMIYFEIKTYDVLFISA